MLKKLLVLAAVGAIAYAAYRQFSAGKAEEDLWSEATTETDLR